ncbi:hypothetical protein [Empedobacter brevis]|uniref:hypothetical protein n=1 Tax=Empedobacter brevis TaxID=247 RepID=UPI0023F482B8|nr:hypothetical protein [Empedobacter brevis]
MELTGKAKEDFLKSNGKKEAWINIMLPIYQQAIIIEWFDSVGIYIDAEFFRKNIKDEPQFVSSTTDEWNGLQPLRIQFSSRQEATEQAIIKANQIYNERFK